MKKILLTILLSSMAMTATFAKTAVVYFSATGTTQKMAKTLAEEIDADIFEIDPVHKYTAEDLNWHDKKSLTTIECRDPKSRPLMLSNLVVVRTENCLHICRKSGLEWENIYDILYERWEQTRKKRFRACKNCSRLQL